ncbi:MAG: hypothetical protein ACLPN1_11650 [Dissulfurispiraceae bacterium]
MVTPTSRFAFLMQAVFPRLLILPSVSFCGDIVVQPGEFDHLDIKIQQKMSAGDKVPAEIAAVDSFNNIIPNFEAAKFRILRSGKSLAVTLER